MADRVHDHLPGMLEQIKVSSLSEQKAGLFTIMPRAW